MGNSSLIDYTLLSPNRTSPRNHIIDTITIHCMAGNMSIETCGNLFYPSSIQTSSNYGIGSDGRRALYCHEANRSWCTSSADNDHRAITIEVANDGGAPDWHISDKALQSLIELCADICSRNDIKRLLWKADKSLIGNVSEQNMTVHRWFSNKACPGDYLYNLHGYIADEVNKILDGIDGASSDIELKFDTVICTPTSSNEELIWSNLKGYGLTDAGAAGVMGNLYAESGLQPNNLQNSYETILGFTDEHYTQSVDNGSYVNFVNDSAGYGLAQWTYYSRKQGLYDLAKSTGKSIADLELQMDWLLTEFNSFGNMVSILRSTNSVKEASDIVLTDYERPADMSDSVKIKRSDYSQTYYDKYKNIKIVNTPVIEEVVNETPDDTSSTTVTNVRVLSLTTKEVAAIQTKRESKTVLDLQTGLKFNISWAAASTYHSDFTPMTSADVDVIKEILKRSGSSCNWTDVNAWSWNGRPGVLFLNDSTYVACGFHLRPHAAIMGGNPGSPFTNQSNTRPAAGWALGGHMCMYYGDSPGGTPSCNTAATQAYELGNKFFQNNSVEITTPSVSSTDITECNYIVKVIIDSLNYRSGPGTNNSINGTIKDKGYYTIIAESSGQGASKWGKLKSGAGWISLDFVTK